jgi:hypothetical protein
VNEAISIAFFAVAADSMLYVVQELMHVNRKFQLTVLVDAAPRAVPRVRDGLRPRSRRTAS